MNASTSTAKALFLAAIKLPQDAWSSFLDKNCGTDAHLRKQLEDLLAAHARNATESPLAADSTAAFAPDSDETAAIEIGTTIGPYAIREQIGEGGMGLVFVAEQTHPVRRKVALKLIKPGMDSRQVVARFEAERQALALMDHPHISKVLDAGTTPTGRPYFVMELVKGEPITDYCDRKRLNLRDRLELLLQVCQAVQHAHQKGVIHRDLKPSNVLVAVHDVIPVVKVIDFGIAKAVGQSLTDKTVYTAVDQFVGTPLYMSPEQAGQSSLDVDTRTDVYALGVLLYELLTGTTPIDPETVRTLGLDEVRRIIREDDPPLPSARVSTLRAAALSTVADKRAADPRKLSRQVRGELDWVVMRCLEKDRSRRYESASALAADLQRFLVDEPVAACPPSAIYRLKKMARRNKAALATVAAVALALMAGTAVSAWQAVDAIAARRLADDRAENERQARIEADRQRQRAEANFQKAIEAVDRMLTRVGEERLREVPQMEPVRRLLLEDALAFFRGFLSERRDDKALRLETALALQRAGTICWELGRVDEATAEFEEGRDLLEALHASDPENALYRVTLSSLYESLGWRRRNTLAEKERFHRRSIELLEPVVATQSADFKVNGRRVRSMLANNLSPLSHSLIHLGRLEEAEVVIQRAIELSKDDKEWVDAYACSCSSLAKLYKHRGLLTKAIQINEKAIAAREAVVRANPSGYFRAELAFDWFYHGGYLAGQGKGKEADSCYRRAADLADPLVNDFPSVIYYRQLSTDIKLALCRVLQKCEKTAEARTVLGTIRPTTAVEFIGRASAYRSLNEDSRALSDLTEAIRLDPEHFEAHKLRGDINYALGNGVAAIENYTAAIGLKKEPENWYLYMLRAVVHFGQREFSKALADLTKALELNPNDLSPLIWIGQEKIATCPDSAFREGILGLASRAIQLSGGSPDAYLARASLYSAINEGEKARKDWVDAIALCKRRLAENTTINPAKRSETIQQMSAIQASMGQALLQSQQFVEAEGVLRECLSVRAEIMPDSWLHFNAISLLGGSLLGQKRYVEAEPLLLRGYEGMKQRASTMPLNSPRLAEAVERLVQLYKVTNQPEKAAEMRAKVPREVAPPPRSKSST